jgi:hypothetical protein
MGTTTAKQRSFLFAENKKNSPREPQRIDTRVYMGRKAAKVAQTKNKNDAIRTKLYGKFGKEIARAAKEGGTGTDNVRLQTILKDAKRMSVPADLIERNLKKASEAKGGDFMELTYECYGHGGVGIVMEGQYIFSLYFTLFNLKFSQLLLVKTTHTYIRSIVG